jgi:hypothetical protein
MRITQSFGSYNSRRYGRPWISKIISWPVGDKAEVAWGSYLGNDNGGEVEIEANPGDIIRTGQKDGRGNGTSADWYIVSLDGSLNPTTAAKAKAHWESTKIIKTNPLSAFSTEELIAEISRRNSV